MKVSIKSVIDDAKFRLGLRDSTYADADLERLINQAALKLDTTDTYVVGCQVVDVDCSKAKLPEGVIDVLAIKPHTNGGCSGCCNIDYDPETDESPTSLVCSCSDIWVVNRGVLTAFNKMGNVSCSNAGNFFDVQNNYLIFPSTVTFDEVTVWYQGYNMDEDGLMVLDEEWERGLAAYAAYQYAFSGQNYKLYPQAKEWQKEWVAQLNKVRGKSFQRDHRQHKPKFASIARAILLSPITNFNNNI